MDNVFGLYQAFFAQTPWATVIIALVFGLLIGSFLNVVAYRLPIMLAHAWQQDAAYIQAVLNAGYSLIQPRPLEFELSLPAPAPPPLTLNKPRSRCPKCETQIKAWQNIPLLSFLILRGRCANKTCDAKIPKRYFLVELGTGLASALVIHHFGATALGGCALLLTWTLIALTLIDLDTQLLPDQLTLPLLWLGLLLNFFGILVSLEQAVLGAIAGYMSLWLIFHIFKLLTKKEGMGFGDFKLFAAIGAWLGISALPATLMIASLSGSIIGLSMILLKRHKRQVPIAFGPYLALGGWLMLVFAEQINQWLPFVPAFGVFE